MFSLIGFLVLVITTVVALEEKFRLIPSCTWWSFPLSTYLHNSLPISLSVPFLPNLVSPLSLPFPHVALWPGRHGEDSQLQQQVQVGNWVLSNEHCFRTQVSSYALSSKIHLQMDPFWQKYPPFGSNSQLTWAPNVISQTSWRFLNTKKGSHKNNRCSTCHP